MAESETESNIGSTNIGIEVGKRHIGHILCVDIVESLLHLEAEHGTVVTGKAVELVVVCTVPCTLGINVLEHIVEIN